MTGQREQTGITRRSVVKAGAWAAPVVAVSMSVPVASASVYATTMTVTPSSNAVDRCTTIDTTEVLLLANDALAASGKEQSVTVTLPAGLSLNAGGTQTTATLTTTNGTVVIPKIYVQATTAGTYSFAVSWTPTSPYAGSATVTTSVSVAVTTPLLPATLLVRSGTAANAGVTQESIELTDPQGGDSDEENTYVVAGGKVYYWGALTNGTLGSEGTLSYNSETLSSANGALISVWSRRAANETVISEPGSGTGGGLVVANGALYQWTNTIGAAPVVTAVTGISSGETITEVQANSNGGYVLTSGGVYFVSTTGAATKILSLSGLSGISDFSSYGGFSDGTNTGVVAAAVNTADSSVVLYRSTGGGTMSVMSGAPKNVRSVTTYGNYIYAFTETNEVYVAYGGGSNWTWTSAPVATGVIDLSTWRKGSYSGGAMQLADGSVRVFIYISGTSNLTVQMISASSFGSSRVVQTWSEDGIYLALTADGKLWAWSGNANQTLSAVTTKASGISNATIWGWHGSNGLYYGGGLAGTALGACNWTATLTP